MTTHPPPREQDLKQNEPVTPLALPALPIRILPGQTISDEQMRILASLGACQRDTGTRITEVRLIGDDKVEYTCELMPYAPPTGIVAIDQTNLIIRSLEIIAQEKGTGPIAKSLFNQLWWIANRLLNSFGCEDDDDALLEIGAVIQAALDGLRLSEATKRRRIVGRLLRVWRMFDSVHEIEKQVARRIAKAQPMKAGTEKRLARQIVETFAGTVSIHRDICEQLIEEVRLCLARDALADQPNRTDLAHAISGRIKFATGFGDTSGQISETAKGLAVSIPLMAGKETSLDAELVMHVLRSRTNASKWEAINTLLAEIGLSMASPSTLERNYRELGDRKSKKVKDRRYPRQPS